MKIDPNSTSARETPLAQAERHVREGKARIAKQTALLDKLEQDGHERRAQEAREILHTLEESQAQAQEHLAQERKSNA